MKQLGKIASLLVLMFSILGLMGCAATSEQGTTTTTESMQEPAISDRSQQPEAGPAPQIELPATQKASLENGLKILLVEYNELPMVVAEMVVNTGSAADPVLQPGLASMTASMLDEGTDGRSALEVAEDVDFIGAHLQTGSTWSYSYVELTTLKKHMDTGFEVFSDVILHPSMPEKEFERVKKERLNSILQKRDRPNTIAMEVFYKVIYTAEHPYGTPSGGTKQSVEAFSRKDLMGFWESMYRPNNSTLIVVGDITMDELLPKVQSYFADWEASDTEFPSVPDLPDVKHNNIYVVDKPGAPQSQIRIGHPGLHRDNQDYAAVQVMNELLGGSFGSRINMNLREDKGFTYGARSFFVYRKGIGPFLSYAGVKTSTTDSSIIEFMKEFRTINEAPVTAEELGKAKSSLTLSMARETETPGQILGMLVDRVVFSLPDNYLEQYVSRVRSVTIEDIQRVAQSYIRPDEMAIVVVGDVETIKPGLEMLDFGEVIPLDPTGDPVE